MKKQNYIEIIFLKSKLHKFLNNFIIFEFLTSKGYQFF
jgi:hypothetical protein